VITKNIIFKNFNLKLNNDKIKKDIKLVLKEKSIIIKSLSPKYKNYYNKKTIQKLKNYLNVRIIGMGGSALGAKSIYEFLKQKIKKNFFFIDNLNTNKKLSNSKRRNLNLIVSKSGNTLETISNVNIFIKKKDKNIFITENKESYLSSLASSLKDEIIHHNNFIGGRFSVLSEVGMLPAELMGLKINKFSELSS